MGKNKNKGGKDASGGQGNDRRARNKVNHRDAGRDRDDEQVPQELIEKAAMLGCEVWEIDEYEARDQMRERDAAAEQDSDDSGELSEESKQAVKPRAAKAKNAAANREMPPSDSSEEEDGPVTEVIPEEEEKKGESDD